MVWRHHVANRQSELVDPCVTCRQKRLCETIEDNVRIYAIS